MCKTLWLFLDEQAKGSADGLQEWGQALLLGHILHRRVERISRGIQALLLATSCNEGTQGTELIRRGGKALLLGHILQLRDTTN